MRFHVSLGTPLWVGGGSSSGDDNQSHETRNPNMEETIPGYASRCPTVVARMDRPRVEGSGVFSIYRSEGFGKSEVLGLTNAAVKALQG